MMVRRYGVALAALIVVLGFSRMTMAGDQLKQKKVNVNATVALYASLEVTAPSALAFDGIPAEVKSKEDGSITKNANCEVVVTAEVTTPLTNTTTLETITTKVKLDEGPYTLSESANNAPGPGSHILGVQGTLATPEAQSAGNYQGEITVTVSTL